MNLPRQNSAWVDGDGRPTRDLYNWARQITVQPQTGSAPAYALGDLTNVRLSGISDGDVLTWSNTQGKWINSAPSSGGSTSAYISVTFDNGGVEIDDNSQCDVQIPYGMTITKVTLLANTTGSIVVDIWKDSYGNFPPTVADTITASAKPTISSADKYQDSALTGWDKTISAGDTLRFNVDSCATITRCLVILEGSKS